MYMLNCKQKKGIEIPFFFLFFAYFFSCWYSRVFIINRYPLSRRNEWIHYSTFKRVREAGKLTVGVYSPVAWYGLTNTPMLGILKAWRSGETAKKQPILMTAKSGFSLCLLQEGMSKFQSHSIRTCMNKLRGACITFKNSAPKRIHSSCSLLTIAGCERVQDVQDSKYVVDKLLFW